MAFVLVLCAATPDVLPAAIERVELTTGGGAWDMLGPSAAEARLEAFDPSALRQTLDEALNGLPVDHCLTPDGAGRRKRLLLADMDSTIIGCECLDELADFAGVKAEVSAITERAMRGEIDFAVALRERVAMLQGL